MLLRVPTTAGSGGVRIPTHALLARPRMAGAHLRQSERIASTTTILNSSAMSAMNDEICFMSRSTENSEPVFSSVVIASVAIERFESEISDSRSYRHGALGTPGTLAHSQYCAYCEYIGCCGGYC